MRRPNVPAPAHKPVWWARWRDFWASNFFPLKQEEADGWEREIRLTKLTAIPGLTEDELLRALVSLSTSHKGDRHPRLRDVRREIARLRQHGTSSEYRGKRCGACRNTGYVALFLSPPEAEVYGKVAVPCLCDVGQMRLAALPRHMHPRMIELAQRHMDARAAWAEANGIDPQMREEWSIPDMALPGWIEAPEPVQQEQHGRQRKQHDRPDRPLAEHQRRKGSQP